MYKNISFLFITGLICACDCEMHKENTFRYWESENTDPLIEAPKIYQEYSMLIDPFTMPKVLQQKEAIY